MSKESIPAFPVNTESLNGHQTGVHTWQYPGMTLRDYFAAKAMQSIYMRLGGGPCAGSDHDGGLTNVAKNAYYMADAMLAERAK